VIAAIGQHEDAHGRDGLATLKRAQHGHAIHARQIEIRDQKIRHLLTDLQQGQVAGFSEAQGCGGPKWPHRSLAARLPIAIIRNQQHIEGRLGLRRMRGILNGLGWRLAPGKSAPGQRLATQPGAQCQCLDGVVGNAAMTAGRTGRRQDIGFDPQLNRSQRNAQSQCCFARGQHAGCGAQGNDLRHFAPFTHNGCQT